MFCVRRAGGDIQTTDRQTTFNLGFTMKWNLLESDPGVFSELVERVGVRGVEFEELVSLHQLQQQHGYSDDPTRREGTETRRIPLQKNNITTTTVENNEKNNTSWVDEDDEAKEMIKEIKHKLLLLSTSCSPPQPAPPQPAGNPTIPQQQALSTASMDVVSSSTTTLPPQHSYYPYDSSSLLHHTTTTTTDDLLGLVFLFKWEKQVQERAGAADQTGQQPEEREPHDHDDHDDLTTIPPDLFFAAQTVENACASQALLSILLNRLPPSRLGDTLNALRTFTHGFDYYTRGDAVGGCEALRAAHNSFRVESAFFAVEDDDDSQKREDAFHFISYVPFRGQVYELDGLAKGPRCLGSAGDYWVRAAIPAIQKRMDDLQKGKEGSDIRFNLLACVESRLDVARRDMQFYRVVRLSALTKLLSFGEEFGSELEHLLSAIEEDDSLEELTSQQLVETLPDEKAAITRVNHIYHIYSHTWVFVRKFYTFF